MLMKPKIGKDLTDKSVETDTARQEKAQRQSVVEGWSEDQARETAANEGLELTDAHMRVIRVLQGFYVANGEVAHARELSDMLADVFENQGGRRHLHQLFPQGPVTQGMRLAGLPVPPDAKDGGFGTAR